MKIDEIKSEIKKQMYILQRYENELINLKHHSNLNVVYIQNMIEVYEEKIEKRKKVIEQLKEKLKLKEKK